MVFVELYCDLEESAAQSKSVSASSFPTKRYTEQYLTKSPNYFLNKH